MNNGFGAPELTEGVERRGLARVTWSSTTRYYSQVSESPTAGDHCIIVEVPRPEPAFVDSASVCQTSLTVRNFIKSKLLANQEPSSQGSVMAHPAFVKIAGQLCYDDVHVGDPPRGKKGMQAATL